MFVYSDFETKGATNVAAYPFLTFLMNDVLFICIFPLVGIEIVIENSKMSHVGQLFGLEEEKNTHTHFYK